MEGIQTTIKYAGPGDNVAVIKVGGYIDTTTSAELERALGSLLKKSQHRIVVDLGDVDYISSAGWGIFISEIKGIKENSGDLKLVKMIPEVYEVFELLEFHYILKAYDTLDEAVDAFVKESGGTLSSAPANIQKAVSQPVQTQSMPTPVTKSASQQTPVAKAQKAIEEDDGDEFPVKQEEELSGDDQLGRALEDHPSMSAWQLKKLLATSEYGSTQMGWFEIRRKMKTVNRK